LNDQGLTGQNPYSPYLPPPIHKSAGLAFGLSALIPGAGQIYCGKKGRGGLTLGFWLLGLLFCFTGEQLWIGIGIALMFVLWVFSFIDAYFTAIEVSRGQDEIVDAQNPRVAVVLNLLTSGFGYFYLGERSKGIALFIGMQVARLLILPKVPGVVGTLIAFGLFVVQLAVAADAYRIAERQLKEALGPEATPQPNAPPASRLPKEVPLALAGLFTFGFVVLAIVGIVLGPVFNKRPRMNARRIQRTIPVSPTTPPAIPQRALSPEPVDDSVPIQAIDLATAVLDVQRVQRRTPYTKDDIPSLTQDVRVLGSIADRPKSPAADLVVARFNRAIALATINMAYEHAGEPMDAAAARRARADLDKIINGPSLISSQTQGITIANSEYWAGYIARNQLHDDKAAYDYWEKCASDAHAGCIGNLAEAHLTGDGGQKVDVNQALDLMTAVYNSGIDHTCAGGGAALGIAEIGYFLGVRRPGDDDVEWARKGDVLWDRLESRGSNRNLCGRGENEIEEFLLQMGHGHRDDNILQDGLSRLDDDAKAPKAVIQYIAGAIDEPAMLAAVQSDKSEDLRCGAYFDVAWYAKLHNEVEQSRRYYQRMAEIGKLHCGIDLLFASKLNP
jgi:TM2 domain-containing membrane protein YozV/TPR repeat protein